MSQTVRGKIQQLIQDLEEHEAFAQVDDTATSAAAEYSTTKQLAIVAEGDVSSVSLGLSDLTRTENSEDDVTPGTTLQHGQQPHWRHSSSSSSGSGLRRHVAELEAKVLELLLDRKAAEARHSRELAAKEAEHRRLQAYIDDELTELQQRQAQVEAAAPPVKQQLQEARAALQGDLVISAEAYAQLKRVPAERLLLVDAVRIAVHEALKDLSADNERLRLSATAAREAAARQADELTRLQRENARLEATLATTTTECSHLTSQLQDVIVTAEVGRSKLLLYDEVSARTEKLEAEVARLAGIEATADRLRSQLAAADAAVSGKDAILQLLTADKAYLSKEVQVAESRMSDLTARLASAEEKVTHLKGERSRLYQQLAASADANRSQDESRLEREISRMHAAAAVDLQRIRQEASDAAEREGRLLRELRDAALDEASRTKSELRQLREQYEELLLTSREAASRADVAHSQLMGELQLKGFELSRLQALSEERASALEKLQLQLELANEKVAVLTAELTQMEQEGRQALQHLEQQLAEATTRLKEYATADGLIERAITSAASAGDSAVSSLEQHLASLLPSVQSSQRAPAATQAATAGATGTLSGAMQRRIHHNIQLAARCARLESQKKALETDKAELSTRLDKAQAAAEKLHRQLELVGQPHNFLLKQLAAAEAASAAAEAQLAETKAALSAREAQSQEVTAERAALRRDLERLLRERGTLDSLRQVVAAALVNNQGKGSPDSDTTNVTLQQDQHGIAGEQPQQRHHHQQQQQRGKPAVKFQQQQPPAAPPR